MPSNGELDTAMRETLRAVLRMPGKGVSVPFVIPAALIVTGLQLLESVCTRKAISLWLHELSQQYADPESKDGLV